MRELAYSLAPCLPQRGALLIKGPLGAGKTCFCRHLIQAKQVLEINHYEDVPSPTFTLIQTYQFDNSEIWHCDLYRINKSANIQIITNSNPDERELIFHSLSPRWKKFSNVFESIKF